MPDISLLGAQTIDDEVRERLVRRLLAEKPISEAVHVLLVALITAMVWGSVPDGHALRMVVAVSAAAIGRAYFRVRARKRPMSEALRAMRFPVLAVGLAWGASIILVGPTIPMELLSLVIVVFAGIVAGATVSLLADPASFYLLLASLLGPLGIAVALNGSDNPHFYAVLFIGLFGMAMSVFYRRSHRDLVQQYRTAIELENTTAEARQAREAEQYLVRIIESTTDFVSIADPDGRLRYLNRAGREMLGYGPADDIAGRSFLDVVHERARPVLAERQATLLREGSWRGETVLRHRDGREIPVSVVALAHRDADGRVDSLSAIARDVSEQARVREALAQARDAAEQSNAAKSSFLANTSHEIRTPLNGILGMVELLLDTDLSPSQRRSVDLIARSGETLLNTINDVLDLSKIEAQQLELERVSFDLHDVVHSTARLFMPGASSKGLELVTDVDPALPQFVLGDPHRLRQVLSNLIGNAIKFTEDGDVVVSARGVVSGDGHAIRIGVRDSGIGIAPDQRERVFEPFRQVDTSTTRQFGGTGLGLSISRRLVELMGGRLELTSAPGQGSDFSFTVPLPKAPEAQEASIVLPGRRVLVADDHAVNRRVLEEVLRMAGCEVLSAAGAAQAVAQLESAARSGRPVDAVVSDVYMPGSDGFALAGTIRAHADLGDPAIILLTSASKRGDTERCRQLRVAAYMQKPVSRTELLTVVAAALTPHPISRSVTPRSVPRVSRDESQSLRILLAEDNAVNREVAVAMLRKRGHEVVTAENGQEAIDAMRGGAFDLVLMDVQMPVLDGLEATRRIRELPNGGLPIVALTANASSDDRNRCLAAGMTDFLTKPFKPAELFRIVESLPGAPSPPVPLAPLAQVEDSEPPVDLPGFHESLEAVGVADLADRMLEVFLSDSVKRAAALEAAARAGDLHAVARSAHGLKSAAGNIRANRLVALLAGLEETARQNDSAPIAGMAAAFRAEYEAVRRYLESRHQPSH